jgi:hypothetical protein
LFEDFTGGVEFQRQSLLHDFSCFLNHVAATNITGTLSRSRCAARRRSLDTPFIVND